MLTPRPRGRDSTLVLSVLVYYKIPGLLSDETYIKSEHNQDRLQNVQTHARDLTIQSAVYQQLGGHVSMLGGFFGVSSRQVVLVLATQCQNCVKEELGCL